MLLRTDRLILRPLRHSDTDDIFKLRSDPETMRFWDWPPDIDVGATRQIVRFMVEEMRAGGATYFIARTHSEEFAGLHDLSDLASNVPDVGFMIPRMSWGLGYGYEAAEAVVSEAWRRNCAQLKARVHAENRRSIALLMRLGFRASGAVEETEVRPNHRVLCRRFALRRLP